MVVTVISVLAACVVRPTAAVLERRRSDEVRKRECEKTERKSHGRGKLVILFYWSKYL